MKTQEKWTTARPAMAALAFWRATLCCLHECLSAAVLLAVGNQSPRREFEAVELVPTRARTSSLSIRLSAA